MEASNVTSLLFKNLSFRQEKQKIIAANIANVNTPKYKTKDIKFSDYLNQTKEKDLPLATTNPKHFDRFVSNKPKATYEIYEVQGLEEQNDGNNVNLDREISNMAQNKILFDAISKSIKKDANWFKMIVDASAKN
jgi:flagellar basal-body rod protein FlgB